MYPASTTSCTPCSCSQAAIAASRACRSANPSSAKTPRRRSRPGAPAPAPSHPACRRRRARISISPRPCTRSISAWRFVPGAGHPAADRCVRRAASGNGRPSSAAFPPRAAHRPVRAPDRAQVRERRHTVQAVIAVLDQRPSSARRGGSRPRECRRPAAPRRPPEGSRGRLACCGRRRAQAPLAGGSHRAPEVALSRHRSGAGGPAPDRRRRSTLTSGCAADARSPKCDSSARRRHSGPRRRPTRPVLAPARALGRLSGRDACGGRAAIEAAVIRPTARSGGDGAGRSTPARVRWPSTARTPSSSPPPRSPRSPASSDREVVLAVDGRAAICARPVQTPRRQPPRWMKNTCSPLSRGSANSRRTRGRPSRPARPASW